MMVNEPEDRLELFRCQGPSACSVPGWEGS